MNHYACQNPHDESHVQAKEARGDKAAHATAPDDETVTEETLTSRSNGMRILLTGASGHLGAFLLLEARRLGLDLACWTGVTTQRFAGFDLTPLDLTDPARTEAEFHRVAPDLVLHTAAVSALADCVARPELAHAVNVEATRRLVELTAASGARLLYTSTDLVFDGRTGDYREDDPPNPLSVYARTKLAAEAIVLSHPRNLVVRLGWLAGPKLIGKPRFFDEIVQKLLSGQQVQLFKDEWRSPLGLPTAADALWNLALGPASGLLHLGGPERLSRYEMGLRMAAHLGVDATLVEPASQAELKTPEPRPSDVSLNSAKWRQLCPKQRWETFDATLEPFAEKT